MIKKPWHLTNEMYNYSRLENRTLDDLMKINPTVVLNVLKINSFGTKFQKHPTDYSSSKFFSPNYRLLQDEHSNL